MGADLYSKDYAEFKKKWDAEFGNEWRALTSLETRDEATQKRIDELYKSMDPPEYYFRDSYNGSSILWRLGMSWWRDVGVLLVDQPEDDTSDNFMNAPPEVCLKLAEMVETATFNPLTQEEVDKEGMKGVNLEETNQYYIKKRVKLINFLKRCASVGGCYMSI